MDLEGGVGITSDFINEEGVTREVFANLMSLDYVECHRHWGGEGRKYIINRVTQVVTVYTIPKAIPLSKSEGKDVSRRISSCLLDYNHRL